MAGKLPPLSETEINYKVQIYLNDMNHKMDLRARVDKTPLLIILLLPWCPIETVPPLVVWSVCLITTKCCGR